MKNWIQDLFYRRDTRGALVSSQDCSFLGHEKALDITTFTVRLDRDRTRRFETCSDLNALWTTMMVRLQLVSLYRSVAPIFSAFLTGLTQANNVRAL